jgi:hypothetical protein
MSTELFVCELSSMIMLFCLMIMAVTTMVVFLLAAVFVAVFVAVFAAVFITRGIQSPVNAVFMTMTSLRFNMSRS